jgi:hypothetical protein
MSTSLTFTTTHISAPSRPVNHVKSFSSPDRRGWDVSFPRPMRPELFVRDRRGRTLDFIMRSARRGRIPLLEANEVLALHHFYSFVVMHILGDNSDSFGDDNDDHQHSLIGGVPRPNAADVINWRPLEVPGTRSHTILWLSNGARRKFILKWEIVLCNSQMNE